MPFNSFVIQTVGTAIVKFNCTPILFTLTLLILLCFLRRVLTTTVFVLLVVIVTLGSDCHIIVVRSIFLDRFRRNSGRVVFGFIDRRQRWNFPILSSETSILVYIDQKICTRRGQGRPIVS